MMERNNEKTPQVSVIMPAYNAGHFIEEAVRSVMAQTFTDWELLILDDGSSDDTLDIAQRLAREDSRVWVLPNERNMGVAKTRNRGFDLCRGEYVALLDSDDIWYPEKLEKQLALAAETGVELLYCSYQIVNEAGSSTCADFIVPESIDFDGFLARSVISCSTAMLSKGLASRYRFEEDFYHEDLALWLHLLKDGCEARGVTEVLAAYRVMGGTRASNKVKSAQNRWRIYRGYLHLGFFRSARLLAEYALLGLRKYRKKH